MYKTAYERLQGQNVGPDQIALLHFSLNTDQRRYNLPTGEEVAVIISDRNNPDAKKDVMLELRIPNGMAQKRITDFNPAYQPLLYILLFPRGEHGWHLNIPLNLPEHDNDDDDPEDQQESAGVKLNKCKLFNI